MSAILLVHEKKLYKKNCSNCKFSCKRTGLGIGENTKKLYCNNEERQDKHYYNNNRIPSSRACKHFKFDPKVESEEKMDQETIIKSDDLYNYKELCQKVNKFFFGKIDGYIGSSVGYNYSKPGIILFIDRDKITVDVRKMIYDKYSDGKLHTGTLVSIGDNVAERTYVLDMNKILADIDNQ